MFDMKQMEQRQKEQSHYLGREGISKRRKQHRLVKKMPQKEIEMHDMRIEKSTAPPKKSKSRPFDKYKKVDGLDRGYDEEDLEQERNKSDSFKF